MSAETFLAAMRAEIARLADMFDADSVSRRRTIQVLAGAYADGLKKGISGKKTLERQSWLYMNYATWPGLKQDIVDVLNTLPGDKINAHEVSNWVNELGVRRSREALGVARRRGVPKNKDGSFSVAKVIEQDALDVLEECPVTLDDALEWGRRNGLKHYVSIADALTETNRIRMANRLPKFTIIGDKPSQGPLPKLIIHNVSSTL